MCRFQFSGFGKSEIGVDHPPPLDFFMWQRMVDIELVTAHSTLTGNCREVQHQFQVTIQLNLESKHESKSFLYKAVEPVQQMKSYT